MRTLLKVLLIVSILVLLAVPVFVLFIWAAGMVVGGIFAAAQDLSIEPGNPFFGFVGSPLFYVEIAAASLSLLSVGFLIFTRKK